MMRLGTVLLTATITVLWLLVGCTDGDGAKGGQQHEAGVDDSSNQRQRGGNEERTVSVVRRQPTVSVEPEDNRNSKLVFQSGSGEIWAMKARGSELVRLTQNGKPYPTSSLSPDGKKIAFASQRIEGGCGGASACASTTPEKSYGQIYVMNTDGSEQTLLLEDSALSSSTPTWSPDGKTIAFALYGADDNSCTIYAMNADGSGHRTALTTLEGRYSIGSLSWSPDGKKIAFEGSIDSDVVDIWVVNVTGETGETNQPQQLTHAPYSWQNVGPTWSPDSTEIAFTDKATTGYDSQIHKINADGSGQTRLTRDPAHYGNPADAPINPTYSPMHSPAWSPDGEQITFVRGYELKENPNPYSDTFPISSAIYSMESDGSDPTLIRDFPLEQVSNLDWLPGHVDLPLAAPATDAANQEQTEKTISEKPARPTDDCKPVEESSGEIAFQVHGHIWTMNADGSDPTRLTHNQSNEDTPAWSPDGKKIAFVKEVEVEAEGGSLSETPTVLVQKVVVMDANGCNEVELPVPEGKGAYEPSWSPDGRRIAFWFVGDCGMFITNADGSGTPRRLSTPGVSGCAARPEWSPDATQIAFQGAGQDAWADIYVMDISPEGDTSRPQRLTDDDLLYAEEPSWSPEGTEIAFKSRGDIYKIDVNTLKETRLTNNQRTVHDPTWSPDGGQIAFVRDNSTGSSSAIYVMRSDGSDLSLVRNFPLGDGELEYDGRTIRPDWRPLP